MVEHIHRSYVPARSVVAADPLLLLNSLATTTAIWDPLLPDFATVTSVVRLDYPGHGLSPARDLPADLDRLAEQVIGVMDAMGIERAHVAGVSIGGMSALRLATLVPDRIRTIGVIGSAPRMEKDLWHTRKRIVREWGTSGLIPDVLRRWFTAEFSAAHPGIVAAYTDMLVGTVDSAYAGFCDVLAGVDMRAGLSEIACPTVVISGTEDAAATVADGKEITGRIAGTRHEVIAERHTCCRRWHRDGWPSWWWRTSSGPADLTALKGARW